VKDRIIQALQYPRALIRGGVELHACSHGGNYHEQASDCADCHFEPECAWLFSHDEHIAFESKSVDDLTEALEFCYGYVDARATQLGHEVMSCGCDACRWLRDAGRLMNSLE